MTLPNFLGIGAQRAGTTWLHAMLRLHPEIFLPASEELHFFDEKLNTEDYQGLGNPWHHVYNNMKSHKDWRWYGKQFNNNKTISGEFEGE